MTDGNQISSAEFLAFLHELAPSVRGIADCAGINENNIRRFFSPNGKNRRPVPPYLCNFVFQTIQICQRLRRDELDPIGEQYITHAQEAPLLDNELMAAALRYCYEAPERWGNPENEPQYPETLRATVAIYNREVDRRIINRLLAAAQ